MINSVYIGDNQSDSYIEVEFQQDGTARVFSHAGWDRVDNTVSVDDLRRLSTALTKHLAEYDG